MKKWLAIVMLMSVCYQYMIKLGIMAWYELNKEYVATELCVNQDKPEMNCCGKCYLNEQLDKVDNPQEDSKQLPSKQQKIELSEFIPTAIAVAHSYLFEDNPTYDDNYQCSQGYSPVISVFHPPTVS